MCVGRKNEQKHKQKIIIIIMMNAVIQNKMKKLVYMNDLQSIVLQPVVPINQIT